MSPSTLTSWQAYRDAELANVKPLLARHGYVLDEEQAHIAGERSVISGRKLVLLGKKSSNNLRVVIKASSSADGQREIRLERTCREMLEEIRFAYNVFLTPEPLAWIEEGGLLIAVSAYVEQACSFLERPLKEQFFLTLKAFETQESAHATTHEHERALRGTFSFFTAETYLDRLALYQKTISEQHSQNAVLLALVSNTVMALSKKKNTIERYNGFLIHADFVPHNIRVVGHDIYVLDHSDIRLANKYDGWARFLNFMTLYHRELETALLTYLQKNRSADELQALHLMRLYRLVELIWYYTKRLSTSVGELRALDEARIEFWGDVLAATLNNQSVSEERVRTYQEKRDSLRSDDEKKRQQGLH